MVMGEDGVPKREGFLQPDDVPRYFDILHRARAKAGDSVFGRRIALITEECRPMQDLFAYQQFLAQGQAAAKAAASGPSGRPSEERVRRQKAAIAAQFLEKAVAAAVDDCSRANASFELANVYRDLLKDDAKALDAYLRTMAVPIEGAGSAVRSHAHMAAVDILLRTKRYDEAIELLDKASGMRRHDYWWARVLSARGAIAAAQGRKAEAMAYYQEALALPGVDKDQAEVLRKKLGTP